MKVIECGHTDYAVCPYCGDEDIDTWEKDPGYNDEGFVDCPSCGKEFLLQNITTTHYSSYKKEDLNK